MSEISIWQCRACEGEEGYEIPCELKVETSADMPTQCPFDSNDAGWKLKEISK